MFFLERCIDIRDNAEMASLAIARAYGFRTVEDFRAVRNERDSGYVALWDAAATMVHSVSAGIQMSERLFAQYEEGVITAEEYILGVIDRLAAQRAADGIC